MDREDTCKVQGTIQYIQADIVIFFGWMYMRLWTPGLGVFPES